MSIATYIYYFVDPNTLSQIGIAELWVTKFSFSTGRGQ